MELVGIDAATLAGPGLPGWSQTVARIGEIARTSGAFGVVNHGIPPALLADALRLTRDFFALPEEVKARAAASPPARLDGFHPRPAHGDIREKFLRTSWRAAPPAAPFLGGEWPPEVPGLAATMAELVARTNELGLRLLRGIAASLGLPDGELWTSFVSGGTALWLLHYPAVRDAAAGTRPDGRGQGTSAHTDFLPMTLILQDEVGGLEVRDERGAWTAVDARAWPVVCQMGDMIGRWSNDVLRPNVHRVASPVKGSRYSLVASMFPSFETVVAPVSTAVGPDRPARYPSEPFGDCLLAWLRALDDGRAGSVADG